MGEDLQKKTGLALTIHQPWAWCVVNGYKQGANCGWNTDVRGWIGIHAGKRFHREGYEWLRDHICEWSPEADPKFPSSPEKFRAGGIIGRARLTGVIVVPFSVRTGECFEWFRGPVGLCLEDPEPLELMPCVGNRGMFRPVVELPF